jgi:hypothetical protein
MRDSRCVIAGLCPAIHDFLASSLEDVDARHKAGHDEPDGEAVFNVCCSGSPVQHGRVRKFPVFPGPAKACVSDRSTLVPERRLSPASKRPISVHQGECQQPGTFGNPAGFPGVSTKEEDT